MKTFCLTGLFIMIISAMGCKQQDQSTKTNKENEPFNYFIEQFADIKVLRYKVNGFDALSLRQKKLAYYLSQAALCGRDILYDQFYKHNLAIRRTLEAIYKGYSGDRKSDEFKKFMIYLKRIWFSNGIHHHYSTDKILPEFSQEYFKHLIDNSKDASFPLTEGESLNELTERLTPIIFDPEIASKRVNRNPETGLLKNSATNFYKDITADEALSYYEKQKDPNDTTPVEFGHNNQTIKKDGKIIEKVWRIEGMYSKAIENIVSWLKLAENVAENEQQKTTIQHLIDFYQHGNLETWDQFNVAWVKDTNSVIDFINGFVEVYNDPVNLKGTWESVVEMIDKQATERMKKLSRNAQWFEDHSPIETRFKKQKVTGITGNVVNVVQLGGDVYPYSPIGINLPNSDWIRNQHGSKSVTLNNIMQAHHNASLESGMLQEFAYSEEEVNLAKQYGLLAHNLHVDMHEVLGHGSGKMLPGISSTDLKNYHSTIEETRADLFALYYLMDDKLTDLGLIPHKDVAKAGYNAYIRNGFITQLTRISLGNDLEEAHMRNRQLICKWVFEKGQPDSVITREQKNGKTYFVINDHQKLRALFAELLSKIQRIKSEGDLQSAKELIETYGVKINDTLHKEVITRYKKLNLAPYTGFINPVLVPETKNGDIIDVTIQYQNDFVEQMMNYSTNYSFLPTYN
ncbi:MAG: dipeptidyl-peptidase 3 family protein [Bacteroidota bacterium]